MLTAGIDIGSVAAKAVIYDSQNGRVMGSAIIPTGWNHKQAFENAVVQAACDYLLGQAEAGASSARTAHSAAAGACDEALQRLLGKIEAASCTGYGRVTIKNDVGTALAGKGFANVLTVSEISCHAKGAVHSFPDSRGVIDIGGQDSKAIQLDPQGNISDFIMNDKCAAGTGRFIQMVANLLEMDLDNFSELAGSGTPVPISSMCAVFAESEIIGLLARQVPPQDIAAGVILSVARRTAGLGSRMKFDGPCVFTGGLAGSRVMADYLSRCLEKEVLLPARPQLNGAVGAAIMAAESAT